MFPSARRQAERTLGLPVFASSTSFPTLDESFLVPKVLTTPIRGPSRKSGSASRKAATASGPGIAASANRAISDVSRDRNKRANNGTSADVPTCRN